ncbi:MAG: thioredoxin domain-containing protein [Bacteroidota bacterium]|nr:thioredoxin domain-containing protein [Bacteroidota bacterium]
MTEHKHTNHLVHETSVYLLQHAHNPVNWYPWGKEALQKAREENKPILVSIGYAACHWCHVMERESFENEETAALMNEHFINIKVDREERPDLDHIYMDAVQAISGGGGWPLNVFLLPDGKPFYGGTYYPPVRAFNRMSWTELLTSIHEMYAQKQNEVEAQADNLLYHLSSANKLVQKQTEDDIFKEENLHLINQNIIQAADTEWGGFGRAPKFPQTFSIQSLLRHYYFTGNESSIQQALLSLDKMIGGGIYDQLGGGFARYSTDGKWLAPHFEKMLYDNALLVTVMSEAFQLTKKELYAEAIAETLQFIKHEMTAPEGGFYSALDADSEGVEGKFYTWSKKEIEDVLGKEESVWFCPIFDVSEEGNWEHTNILWLSHNKNWEAVYKDSSTKNKIAVCKQKLLTRREQRIRPQLDDKIILGWNALLITACCKAFAALRNDTFLKMAEDNICFLEEKLCQNQTWQHSWKNGVVSHSAFLDDYAYLTEAYIQLQEVSGNSHYLLKAKETLEYVLAHFAQSESPLFYFTPDYQTDVVVKKTELYDGATPSANAVLARALHYLSLVFDKPEWRKRAEEMIRHTMAAVIKYPTSFGVWAMAYSEMIKGMNEIIITGKDAMSRLRELQQNFIANKIIQAAESIPNDKSFALLNNRFQQNETVIYVCKEGVCRQPVEAVDEALQLMQ